MFIILATFPDHSTTRQITFWNEGSKMNVRDSTHAQLPLIFVRTISKCLCARCSIDDPTGNITVSDRRSNRCHALQIRRRSYYYDRWLRSVYVRYEVRGARTPGRTPSKHVVVLIVCHQGHGCHSPRLIDDDTKFIYLLIRLQNNDSRIRIVQVVCIIYTHIHNMR
jgi:hypothetical protein